MGLQLVLLLLIYLPSRYQWIMWEEGGVLQKMMDDAERGGYVGFPLDYYKLCQNLPIFYVKIMIFIKATIFIFITVTSNDNFRMFLRGHDEDHSTQTLT